jgi:hypothetical protein
MWNYFQLHANQRLTTFDFCIAPSTLVATASLSIALGFFLTIFFFVSWRSDERNTELIHHGVDAPKHYKNSATSHRKSQTQAVIRLGTKKRAEASELVTLTTSYSLGIPA